MEKLVLSFYRMGPEDETQAVRLGGKCPDRLGCLSALIVNYHSARLTGRLNIQHSLVKGWMNTCMENESVTSGVYLLGLRLYLSGRGLALKA